LADFGIIKSRLDRRDLPGFQLARESRVHARRLVDFQTEPVARAVKKSFHVPVALAGRVAALSEELNPCSSMTKNNCAGTYPNHYVRR
jgi:hypothetical protein